MSTIGQRLDETTRRFERVGIPEPRVDAEWLMAHVTGLKRLMLVMEHRRELGSPQAEDFERLVRIRETRVPLQHLLGSVSFRGFEIEVTGEALIPRPETEILAEVALDLLPRDVGSRSPRVLDLGTGTGCLPVVLAKTGSELQVVAVDISSKALDLARRNIERHGLSDRVELIESDGFKNLGGKELVDVIVSNPPYIPAEEIHDLQIEVKDFDPLLALDGGVDGLDFYRRIATEGRNYLRSGGKVCLEFGDGQLSDIREIFACAGWKLLGAENDLSGEPRIVSFER